MLIRITARVKYQSNTTDEHGNKVMDKISREETLQAMKDIRSQSKYPKSSHILC